MALWVWINHNIARHQVMKYLNSTPLSVPQVPKSSPQTAWGFSWGSHLRGFLWLSFFTIIRHFWGIAGLGSQGKLPSTSRVENCYIQAHSDLCGLDKILTPKQLDYAPYFMKGCCFSTFLSASLTFIDDSRRPCLRSLWSVFSIWKNPDLFVSCGCFQK